MARRSASLLPAPLPRDKADALAVGLGWFSIGLGLAEVATPRALTRGLGMRGWENVVRAYGVREIAAGIGILASRDRTPWVWSRVAGDGLDIATLAAGLLGPNPRRSNVGLALLAVGGVTALDVLCAQSLGAERRRPKRPRRSYADRSGFPRPPQAMRGAASDFEVPPDFRTPELLRPWT